MIGILQMTLDKPKPDYKEALVAKDYTKSPIKESSSRAILESKLLVAYYFKWYDAQWRHLLRNSSFLLEKPPGYYLVSLWSFDVNCFHKFAPILFCKQPPSLAQ